MTALASASASRRSLGRGRRGLGPADDLGRLTLGLGLQLGCELRGTSACEPGSVLGLAAPRSRPRPTAARPPPWRTRRCCGQAQLGGRLGGAAPQRRSSTIRTARAPTAARQPTISTASTGPLMFKTAPLPPWPAYIASRPGTSRPQRGVLPEQRPRGVTQRAGSSTTAEHRCHAVSGAAQPPASRSCEPAADGLQANWACRPHLPSPLRHHRPIAERHLRHTQVASASSVPHSPSVEAAAPAQSRPAAGLRPSCAPVRSSVYRQGRRAAVRPGHLLPPSRRLYLERLHIPNLVARSKKPRCREAKRL